MSACGFLVNCENSELFTLAHWISTKLPRSGRVSSGAIPMLWSISWIAVPQSLQPGTCRFSFWFPAMSLPSILWIFWMWVVRWKIFGKNHRSTWKEAGYHWIPMDFKHSLKCLWNPEKVYRSRNRCWCHRVCHRTTDSKTFPNYSTCQTHHYHQLRSLPELSGFGHMMKYVEIWWTCCEHVVKYGEIRKTWQFPVPDHAYNSPIIGSTQSAFSDIESSIWRPLGVKLHQNSLSWYPGVNEHRCGKSAIRRSFSYRNHGFSTSFCKL